MNYAVLAHETATTLFPYEDPRGQTVKIGSDYYTVVGVTASAAPRPRSEAVCRARSSTRMSTSP